MARQAIVGHFPLAMAVHTPRHRHLHPWVGRGFFALADISMTLLALEFAQRNMAAMREEDVIRLPVKMSPGNLLPLFLKLPDFFLLNAFCKRLFMTFKADG
jgi:hypothetical protein